MDTIPIRNAGIIETYQITNKAIYYNPIVPLLEHPVVPLLEHPDYFWKG